MVVKLRPRVPNLLTLTHWHTPAQTLTLKHTHTLIYMNIIQTNTFNHTLTHMLTQIHTCSVKRRNECQVYLETHRPLSSTAFGIFDFVLNLGSQKKVRNTFKVCQKMLWQVSNKKIKFPGVKNEEKLSKKRISYLLPFRPTFKTAKNFFSQSLASEKPNRPRKSEIDFRGRWRANFFSAALQTNLKLKNGSAWAQ